MGLNKFPFRKSSKYLALSGIILIVLSWIIGLSTNAMVFAHGLTQGFVLLIIAAILWLISLGKD